jgi:hypothetical protein
MARYCTPASGVFDVAFRTEMEKSGFAKDRTEEYKQAVLHYLETHDGKLSHRDGNDASRLYKHLNRFTNRNNSSYFDKDFTVTCVSLGWNPQEKTSTSSHKEAILDFFERNDRRPSSGSKNKREATLARVLVRLTCPSQGQYDKDFANKVARLMPADARRRARAAQRKAGILSAIRGGQMNTAHPDYYNMHGYLTESTTSYDPDFAAKVRALGYGKKQ